MPVCVCVCVYVRARALGGRAHDICRLPANTRARGRGHGRSRTQRPDVCPLCQRCQCSHYGIEARRDRRGSYTPEVLLTPLGLPRPVRPLGLLGFSAIVALVRLFGNGYAFNERLRIVLCKWCEKVGPKAQGIPALYTAQLSVDLGLGGPRASPLLGAQPHLRAGEPSIADASGKTSARGK